MDKVEIETDTYYAIEELYNANPQYGWLLVEDSYGMTEKHDTVEGVKETIRQQKAVDAGFGHRNARRFRIVKITETLTKEVVE